jgi:hypothetical protein
MELSDIANLSTSMSQASALQNVGYAVMGMSLDADQQNGAAAIGLINSAPRPSLDPNVGTHFNASA